jgi:urease accessory protein
MPTTFMGTNTSTSTMTTDIEASALIGLMWLASPALPVGAFAYSEGLEPAVEAGLVRDEASAAAWLVDQLWLAGARSELPAVAHAMAGWRHQQVERVRDVNTWVLLTRECAEQRAQSLQMGRSLHDWVRQGDFGSDARLTWLARSDVTWPVAFALAAVLHGIDDARALLAHGFGWAENMTQAAIKAVPLGQAAAQRVLARLAHELPAAVDHALQVAPDARQAFTPMLALLGAAHEQQYSRIFRS